MKENKHIEKELLFKTNIKDITSISLDIDYNVLDNYVEGNYLINGEYKIHELSINKEKFDFKIPFKYELDTSISKDSVKLEISDFTYDYEKDELIVNIDSILTGDKNEVLEFDTKELLDDFLSDKEVDVIDTRIDEIKDTLINQDNCEKVTEIDIKDEEKPSVESININEKVELKDNYIKERNVDKLVNNVKDNESFVTYKIVKLKDDETLESIVMKYHTTIDELKEYNDLNSLNVNNKIIIPQYE